MRATPAVACALALMLAPAMGANAQLVRGSAGDSLVVSVLTMGPGPEIFDRFGHASLRFRDVRTGVDVAFNWGMFDFAQPHFIWNFLTGETRYWMQGFPGVRLIRAYASARLMMPVSRATTVDQR